MVIACLTISAAMEELVPPPVEGFLGEEEAGFFFVGLGGREPMSSDLIVCFEAVAGLVGFDGDFLVEPEGGWLRGGDEAVSGEFRKVGGISTTGRRRWGADGLAYGRCGA